MIKEEILNLIQFIDLTSLSSTDTIASVKELVDKGNKGISGFSPAALCVYPNLTAPFNLLNPKIKKAVVAGHFPESQASLEAKANELELINTLPVEEVDIVINRGEIISGNYEHLNQEIRQARKILNNKTLKVILETGELSNEQIAKASTIAIQENADFIKTSTGKSKIGATQKAVEIMCKSIVASEKYCGIKISGGVRTIEDAVQYQTIVGSYFGQIKLNSKIFRIGASSLFDTIKKELINHA